VKAGKVVITMMKKMRNSTPWNQMMANTTQDSAGMPCNRVRIGERKLSTARERTITSASPPPTMKAPASPARMRKMVDSTSANIAPEEKISRQRQNTSISDGNRKRGKNSEANCQIAITTTKGSTEVANRLSAASSQLARGDEPDCDVVSLIGPVPDRSSRRMDRPAGTRSIFRPHRPT
jgi:hypothetical protein